MQENTSRAGLPAWIFFILAMIAVIGFVVFQQNRPSDMPPEASVQPPEQPVNKAIETVKDLAAKAVEIADSSKISAEDADETPQETDSALENSASAKAETVARKLGEALRDRRSRRRIAACRGDRLHFRKIIRRSLATGGEPLQEPP